MEWPETEVVERRLQAPPGFSGLVTHGAVRPTNKFPIGKNGSRDMKLNCISCGHSFSLDEAYDNFVGLVKCFICGALLEIRTADGYLQSVAFQHRQQAPPEESVMSDCS
jgi:hypothetical protein